MIKITITDDSLEKSIHAVVENEKGAGAEDVNRLCNHVLFEWTKERQYKGLKI